MRLLPNRSEWVDLLVVAALGVLALLGLRNTYAGWSFLVAGGTALAVGMLLAHLLRAAHQPVLVLAASTMVVYFVIGVPLVVPEEGFLPGLRMLAAVSITGWKVLLTTAPPVPTDTGLLVVPYVLGMVAGVAGVACARLADRSLQRHGPAAVLVRAIAPVAALTAVLVLGLALGTRRPASVLLHGAVFAAISLVWISWRVRRLRPSIVGKQHTSRRFVAGVGVLAAAAAVAFFAVPAVASVHRSVLRDYVVPPLNLSEFPSPLVGFRKYTKDANKLWDQVLFTATGLPSGSSVRIATLDDYDGVVWGAGDEARFRRIGASDTEVTAPQGTPTTVTVTIGAAYAAATDVNPWLPTVGAVTAVQFHGDRARAVDLTTNLYYNFDLATGVLPIRLREGDSYTLTTVLTNPTMPDDVQPGGRPALTENASALLTTKVAAWTGNASGLRDQLLAIGDYLKQNGAFTDGGPGESHFLPGHSLGRLTSFINAAQPAGDDEQYAAAFALIANHLGIPARVVLGARPDDQGVVRGSNVHAWVEVQVATGAWVPIPESQFMPEVTKRPDTQPPEPFQNEKSAVVPPPNAVSLPQTPTDTTRTVPVSVEPTPPNIWEAIWRFLRPALLYGGPPVAIVALYLGLVLGLKRRRGRRRRREKIVANRFDGAWQELLDLVRDTAVVVPQLRGVVFSRGKTRKEQARILDGVPALRAPSGGFLGLASDIDGVIFGVGDPSKEDAAAVWRELGRVSDVLLKGLKPWQRILVRLNPRSLRPEILPPLPAEFEERLQQLRATVRTQFRPAPVADGPTS